MVKTLEKPDLQRSQPSHPVLVLQKIISGGQTGADFAGLVAGRDLGYETGGTAPKGWRICLPDESDGSNPILEKYGLVEHQSRNYPPRTIQNVLDADATLWVGYEYSSGGKLTIAECIKKRKPYLINPTPESLLNWLVTYQVKVLNVAGNKEGYQNPGIFWKTYSLITTSLTLY